MPACTVLLFYRNAFVDLYCHMLMATLAFVTHVMGVVLRILYTPACRETIAAWGIKLNPYGDQRSLDRQLTVNPLYSLKPHAALLTLSIKQSPGQDIPRSFGASGGSSGA